MGTPDFAVPVLEAIKNAGHDIALVISQPDKPKGRGHELAAPPAKEWALKNGVEVYQPDRIRKPECVEHVTAYEADVCVVAAFGQILPRTILDWPKHGCINVHASLLPKYRGAAPIQWSILNGDKTTGITIQQMADGVDTGDILLQRETPIGKEETAGELFDRLALMGGEVITEALSLIEKGEITAMPQDESLATHVGMIDKSLGRIDWSHPAAEIERYIRGLNPWPSAYTRLGNKTLKLWKAKVVEEELGDQALTAFAGAETTCGSVIVSGGRQLVIRCGEGTLSLTEVQLEGKRRMTVDEFLRGNQVPTGTVLG